MTESVEKRAHFIRQLIRDDLEKGKHNNVITRFPPEPNGFLHVGHAKSICLNFSMAQEFQGQCYLRFDDTNPMKEEDVFVKAIMEDVAWLGYTWERQTYSSDYYQALYDFAVDLIKAGNAYVDSLSLEAIRAHRGTLQEPGKNSPYRERSIEENLDLFARMKAGEFSDGEHVLRAKIDMGSPNVNLRDPVMYRIRHVHHQQTGDAWCIYPMYDYAHPISDALEKITHSLCTLEFQDHRPLYDWFIKHCNVPATPVQTEFSRLNVSHTIASKRKLRELVDLQVVDGWDDPRMPTLSGLRKRGFPPKAIRDFCEEVGVSRSDSIIDMTLLENCVRDELNQVAPRAMCVLDPLKIIIDNYDDTLASVITAAWDPRKEDSATRTLPFSRELYIERSDFMEDPPKKFFRLSVGKEVRLRHAYVIRCNEAVKDNDGKVVELRCTVDKDTLGKNPEGRKVKGVIHWVSKAQAHQVDIIHYDRLFTEENPSKDDDFMQFLNANSKKMLSGWCEPALAEQQEGDCFQFERLGYYCANATKNNTTSCWHLVVSLRDSWNATS